MVGEAQCSVTSLVMGPSGTTRAWPPAVTSTLVAVGRSRSNPMPASPIDAGLTATSVTASGRVITSLTKKLPSGSGRAVRAMPGTPTWPLLLWVGVGEGLGIGEVFGVGDGVWLGDVVRDGDIVRVGTTVRDGTPLAGTASVARTGPGQLSPEATATAAPSNAVTV